MVRYVEGSLHRKPRFNEFAEKQPKCSLHRGMVDRFFSGVRQLNRVFSLRHLTIECGKEHRTFDCKNKLLDWDHFFTLTFSRRHWNDKFHIARSIIVENRSGSINKSWRFRLPDFCNRHLFGLLPVSLRVLSHTT